MRLTFSLAALILAAPLAAQDAAPPPAAAPVTIESLSLEQRTALRCGVGFAIVHRLQAEGKPAGANFPDLGDRGREFFVQSTAKLMDDTGADRAGVANLVNAQLAELVDNDEQLEQMMPGCLTLLQVAGL